MSEVNYKQIINLSKKAVKRKDISISDKYTLCLNFLNALKSEYDTNLDNIKYLRELTKIAVDYIKPALELELNRRTYLNDDMFFKIYELYEEMFIFCARKNFKYFLIAMEFKKLKKVWEIRLDLMKPLIYYLEELYFNKELIELIRASFPPRIW